MNLVDAVLGAAQLERFGNREAVICGDRRLSYRDLAELTGRHAAALAAEGLEVGDRVVFVAADTPELLAGFLGAMRMGAVPVSLPTRASDAEIAFAVTDTDARLVVLDRDLPAGTLPPGHPTVPADALTANATRARPGPASVERSETDPAFWVYSSGSTGHSKGIVHCHRDLEPVTRYHREALGAGPGDRFFCTSRLSFAYTLGNAVFAPLHLGATVVQQPDWPTPETALATVRTARPTIVFSTPSLYRAWAHMPENSLADLGGVTRFVSAGEPLPERLIELWRDRTGRIILDCYGCSETLFFVFGSPPEAPRPGSVGFPCAGVEAELRPLVGAADGGADGSGAGRLFVRHPFMAAGYGPGAASQAERLAAEWFESGDLFRRDDDGYWYSCGRADDLLKIAGQWVSLREVEEAAGGLDAVEQAVAVSAHDPDGLVRVALFLTAPPGAEGDAGALESHARAHLDRLLPRFKRPKWLRVIDEMPRTATGKVHRAALRAMIEEGAP